MPPVANGNVMRLFCPFVWSRCTDCALLSCGGDHGDVMIGPCKTLHGKIRSVSSRDSSLHALLATLAESRRTSAHYGVSWAFSDPPIGHIDTVCRIGPCLRSHPRFRNLVNACPKPPCAGGAWNAAATVLVESFKCNNMLISISTVL